MANQNSTAETDGFGVWCVHQYSIVSAEHIPCRKQVFFLSPQQSALRRHRMQFEEICTRRRSICLWCCFFVLLLDMVVQESPVFFLLFLNDRGLPSYYWFQIMMVQYLYIGELLIIYGFFYGKFLNLQGYWLIREYSYKQDNLFIMYGNIFL